jgi:GAF domain-containing protein
VEDSTPAEADPGPTARPDPVFRPDPVDGPAAEAVAAAQDLVAAVVGPEGPDASGLADLAARLGLPPDAAGPLAASLGGARDEVAGLRRRSLELAAVSQSARRLANATRVDETLDHLVRAAHGLVAADLAYLSEYDPDTATLRVRATHGVVHAAFAALPVPTGIGVASRIAQTRRPQAVLDYLAEPGLARSEQMDAAVREEGVQSLLGVPLVANSTVLGVLFVGTRTRHEYTADEVAVLSALADHAAIALLRSLRFGDLERSGDEAVARAAAWEQYFRDQRRVLDVVDELFDAVLSGEDVHHVIGTLAQAVGRQLVLVDEAGGVIAATGDARPQPDPVETTGDPQTPESVGSSESPALPGAGARFRATPDSPDTEAVVVVETRTSGVLRLHVLRAPHGSALLSPETVVRGAQVCAFAHLLGSASRLREDRLRDRLLSAVLSGTGSSTPATANELASAGLPLEALAHIVVVRGPAPDLRRTAAALTGRVAAGRGTAGAADPAGPAGHPAPVGLGGQSIRGQTPGGQGPGGQGPGLSGLVFGLHAGELTVLTDAQSFPIVRTLLDRRTADVPHLTAIHATLESESSAGRSDEAVLGEVRRVHRSAAGLRALVEALAWSGTVIEAAELQPYALLFGPDRAALDAFVESVLGPLLDSEDLPVLEEYFRQGRNLRATAEATRFHVNTITQRLRRIDGLLGPTWRSPDRAFLTEAAVRLVGLDRRLRRTS